MFLGMADDRPREGGGLSLRFVFVACCLVAATTAGVVVASTSTGGIAGSPIDDVLPGESAAIQGGQGGDGGGLGALDPGSSTGVGGEVGLDGDTFGSTDTEIHFTAESPRPTYWRTGTYGEYTGTGWERTTATEPYEEPIEHPGQTGERLDYSVTLERPATAVPTPYRPRAVDLEDLSVGTDGSVVAADGLEQGTTYDGVSHTPADDPALLRAAGGTHPDAVDRYTRLPGETERALSGFTREITADADTKYDSVTAVQSWLRNEKSYSLDVNETSENIAERFVFGMEAGYCEYFATAMATMLRTQDIPTRYVVGYSSGQPAGENSYNVRAMNAHAWVEVYFEGVGWVKFDPTPGEERLTTQQEALEDIGQEYDVTESGGPNETFEPTDPTNPTGTEPPDTPPAPIPEGYTLELNRTPTPGAPLEVTVLEDGRPATFVEILFDGEPIDTSPTFNLAYEGNTATGTVPMRNGTFEIAVRQIPHDTLQQGAVGRLDLSGANDTDTGDGPVRTFNASSPADSIVYRETVRIVTDSDVQVTGEVLPGSTATVTALVGGRPLSGATVSIGGEELDARTGASGRVPVELPERSGNVTIGITDGLVTGEKTVSLPALEVAIEPNAPVALPFTTATVEARYGEEAAIGVPVERDGTRVAVTDIDGERTVRLPFAPSGEFTVGAGALSRTVTVEGLLVNAVFVLVVPLVVLLAVVGYGIRSSGTVLGSLTGVVARLLALPRQASESLRRAALWLVAAPSMLGRGGRRLWNTLIGGRDTGGHGGSPSPDEAAVPTDVSDEQLPPGRVAVRRAWRRFGSHVTGPVTGRTPEELAWHAVERDGLPPAPVWTLLDAFRAVEYGDQPADRHRERAETALSNIEAASTVTEDGEVDPDRSPLVGDGGTRHAPVRDEDEPKPRDGGDEHTGEPGGRER